MYFPNGSSAEDFKERACYRCRNWKERPHLPEDGEGCAIFDAHFLAASEIFGDAAWPPSEAGEKGSILDFLIDEKLPEPWCRLFEEAT